MVQNVPTPSPDIMIQIRTTIAHMKHPGDPESRTPICIERIQLFHQT